MDRYDVSAGALFIEWQSFLTDEVSAGMGSIVRSVIACAEETVAGCESSERIIAVCLS